MRKCSLVGAFGKLCHTVWEIPACCLLLLFHLHSSLNFQCLAFHIRHCIVIIFDKFNSQSNSFYMTSAPCDIVDHSSFLDTFVLLAVRLSFTTFFWGPLALCPAFRGSSKLCPWFFFFHTVPPGTPAYLPYSGYSLPIHIWLPDTYFFLSS